MADRLPAPDGDPINAPAAPDTDSLAASPQLASALGCLKLLLNFHQIAADEDQLKHALGGIAYPEPLDLVRLAKQLGAKARSQAVAPDRLERQPLPAMARLADGTYAIVGKMEDGKVLVHSPIEGRSGVFALADFARSWVSSDASATARGTLVLITTREALTGNSRRFDISWFIPALVKYRQLIGQVLLASLFLQLLALISPILFQVVIDKVLVNQTLATLQVLFVAFIGVSVFEFFIGAGRTWLFSHTTSRIDVELGSRLFKHLLGLPMSNRTAHTGHSRPFRRSRKPGNHSGAALRLGLADR